MKRKRYSAFTLVVVFTYFSTAAASTDAVREILSSIQGWQHERERLGQAADSPKTARPFVTLTYAQSLDGKIARIKDAASHETSSNFPLSGDESLVLTHALRSVHDGILIGGGTLRIDNPRLTNRLWEEGNQPRAVVLDTHLSHIQAVGKSCRLQNPIICCSAEAASSLESLPQSAQILTCQCDSDGNLDIRDVLHQLWAKCGIRSLMVEGGAGVLSSFLREPEWIDAMCVTIAPKLLGAAAIGPSFDGMPRDLTGNARFFILGTDALLLASTSPSV